MSRFEQVILLHGIRTHGKWQKSLGDALSQRGHPHETYDYGRFSLPSFLSSRARHREIELFYDWYSQVRSRRENSTRSKREFRPNVVAHSFGAYLIGYAMKKFEDMKFGKVILCGSILPCDFDWITLFGRNQLLEVRNDYGVEDAWSHIVPKVVRDAGSSGAQGFSIASPLVHNKRFDYFRHSDYFRQGHYEQHWLPFLEAPVSRLRCRRGSTFESEEECNRIFDQTGAIDEAVYGGLDGISAAALPEGLWLGWVRINPDIYTILEDQAGRVLGYINAMPVKPDVFDELLTGKRMDNEVTSDDVLPYSANSEVDLYLMSIAIDPRARRIGQGVEQSGLHRLMFGLTHFLEDLAKDRAVFVRRLGAVGWTSEGQRLCEALGMRPHRNDRFEHPTYLLDLSGEDGAGSRTHSVMRDLRSVYSDLRERRPSE